MPQGKPGLSVGGPYDRLSRMYDAVFAPIEAPLTDAAIEMLDAQPGEQILEIGPGTGRALARIGSRVAPRGTVLGVDLSAQMLAVSARKLAVPAGLSSVRLSRGDARALPLGRAACDAVFMCFTLELFDPQSERQVLAECARVLRRSGRLVVGSLWRTVRPSMAARANELGHRMFPAVLDCRPIDLDGVLRDSGFRIRRSATRSLAGIPVRIVLAAPLDF
jgi:demethylmenaquinone methyltransferase/2-methoxy-6-polyprenyl-1,4-benzoquinol methylase